jgi:hypothetical protein
MAGITRRQLEELKRVLGTGKAGACPECRTVYIIGMPGLFAHAFRGLRVPMPGRGDYGPSEKLTHAEARQYANGCPECGKDVKTTVMSLGGLGDQVPYPDPFPFRLWPNPPEGGLWKAGNMYSDAEPDAVALNRGSGWRR